MSQSSIPSLPSTFTHLSTRPDVDAVLILSRLDGSIIRATGALEQSPTPAPPTTLSTPTPTPAPALTSSSPPLSPNLETPSPSPSKASTHPTPAQTHDASTTTATTATTTTITSPPPAPLPPAPPTRAALLAHQVFSLITSAASLSTALPHILDADAANPNDTTTPRRIQQRESTSRETTTGAISPKTGAADKGGPHGGAAEADEADGETRAGAGADDVQLLRLRLTGWEVVVFPDARFLCCVVRKVGDRGR